MKASSEQFCQFWNNHGLYANIMYSKWVTAPKRGSEIKNKNNNKINEKPLSPIITKKSLWSPE